MKRDPIGSETDSCKTIKTLRDKAHCHILDGDLWPFSIVRFEVHENFEDGLGPVGAIGQKTEVRKWLLRSSGLPFYL